MMESSLDDLEAREYFLEVGPSRNGENCIWPVSPGSGKVISLGQTLVAGSLIHAFAILFTRSLSYVDCMKGQLRNEFVELIEVMKENISSYQGEEVYWYPGAAMLSNIYTPECADMTQVQLDNGEAEKERYQDRTQEPETAMERSVMVLGKYLQFNSIVTLRPWRVYRFDPVKPMDNLYIKSAIRPVSIERPWIYDSEGKKHHCPPIPVSYHEGYPHIYPLASPVEKQWLLSALNVTEIIELFVLD